MALVGGGPGAFIGAVHRQAAALDGEIELVCGAFSADPGVSREFGQRLGLSVERSYADYRSLLTAEASLPADSRCQFVSVVTPNHLHFDVARESLQSGFHVFCEKPATMSVAQALRLADVHKASGRLFALAHTYTGYPMIKAARDMVAKGELGRVVKVVVEYTQGWLASGADDTSKQAEWRLDPDRSGISACMGDIGVHAANLAEFVTGAEISDISADIGRVVPGRQLDDDGSVFLRFTNGARGVLLASQIHVGDENNLRLRVIGERRSIDWSQLEPATLWVKSQNEATRMHRSGVGDQTPAASSASRLPAGHPEGYIEAFANLYRSFAAVVRARESGEPAEVDESDLPGMQAAVRGMMFIENVIKAGQTEQKWLANVLPSTAGASA